MGFTSCSLGPNSQDVTGTCQFVETGHLAENLSIPTLNVSINGDECGQNAYLETLLTNAQVQDYEFVIWSAHRGYDALLQIFPEEVKDSVRLWGDTGLLDENGNKRVSCATWKTVFNK